MFVTNHCCQNSGTNAIIVSRGCHKTATKRPVGDVISQRNLSLCHLLGTSARIGRRILCCYCLVLFLAFVLHCWELNVVKCIVCFVDDFTVLCDWVLSRISSFIIAGGTCRR